MRKKELNEEVKKTWKEEKEQDVNKKRGNVEDERGEKGEKEEKVTEEERSKRMKTKNEKKK